MMYEKQHTLAQAVELTGVGLHTGTPSTIRIKPAPEGHGFVFRRVDLPGSPQVRAILDNVVELERSTTIAENDAKIHTVEHLLAALAGLQIDNAEIEIDSHEPPALDGSARLYVAALHKAGIVEQNANREFIVIDNPVHYHDNHANIDLAALPADELRLSVTVDYNSKVLGIQNAYLGDIQQFESEIAPCRTFCFWHELEYLVKAGLIKGGSLENAIVIMDREVSTEEVSRMATLLNIPALVPGHAGILNNTPMHFPNEPARHKLLDLLGDLTLLGAPLKGQIFAQRPGHASNIAFARQIKADLNRRKLIQKYRKEDNARGVFDIKTIQDILPHRYPFLLVDRITDFTETSIEGIKNVTINEPFFVGHFQGNPIMPGVLQLEAMAQVGGILLLNIIENPKDHWVYLVGLDNARFKRPVVPGDTLIFRLELLSSKRNICKMRGKAYVDDALVCEAEMTASLVKKNQ